MRKKNSARRAHTLGIILPIPQLLAQLQKLAGCEAKLKQRFFHCMQDKSERKLYCLIFLLKPSKPRYQKGTFACACVHPLN